MASEVTNMVQSFSIPRTCAKASRDEILGVLRAYKREFADQYGILELGLFGSVARDTAAAESDVDVCIKTRTPNAYRLVHIKADLEARFRKPVDLIRIRDRMNLLLKERIEKDAVYV
jgi:uncharacterized protein